MSFYHTYTLQLTRMRHLIQAQASSLWCMCFLSKCLRWVSNVYVCYDQTHTLVFGQRCVFILRIHRNWYACVLLFKHMRHICDVCVSCADVFVVFLTYMCILTQHMRSLSDIEDVGTNVFIIISTHAFVYSSGNMTFTMYLLVSQTVAACFLHIRIFVDNIVFWSYVYIIIYTPLSF